MALTHVIDIVGVAAKSTRFEGLPTLVSATYGIMVRVLDLDSHSFWWCSLRLPYGRNLSQGPYHGWIVRNPVDSWNWGKQMNVGMNWVSKILTFKVFKSWKWQVYLFVLKIGWELPNVRMIDDTNRGSYAIISNWFDYVFKLPMASEVKWQTQSHNLLRINILQGEFTNLKKGKKKKTDIGWQRWIPQLQMTNWKKRFQYFCPIFLGFSKNQRGRKE